jgi:hypothetical protein
MGKNGRSGQMGRANVQHRTQKTKVFFCSVGGAGRLFFIFKKTRHPASSTRGGVSCFYLKKDVRKAYDLAGGLVCSVVI